MKRGARQTWPSMAPMARPRGTGRAEPTCSRTRGRATAAPLVACAIGHWLGQVQRWPMAGCSSPIAARASASWLSTPTTVTSCGARHDVDFDPHPVGRRHGNGPKATPVVAGENVYWVGMAGPLECRRARDGQHLWDVNYPAEFGEHQPLPGGLRDQWHGKCRRANWRGAGRRRHYLVTQVRRPSRGTCSSRRSAVVAGARSWPLTCKRGDSLESLGENVSYSSPVVAEIGRYDAGRGR